MKDLDSEELYQLIKEKIKNYRENSKKIKKTISQDYTYTQEEIYCAKKIITFDNNTTDKWISSSFESYLNENNMLTPEIKGKWGTWEKTQKRPGIDISNLIFLSNEDINYKLVNNILKSTVILKGDSEYWIFLHSKGRFNEETIAILFSKAEWSDSVFMSIGIFINSDNEDNYNNNNEDNNNNNEDNNKNNKDNNNNEDDENNNSKYSFRIFQTTQLFRSYNIYDNDNKYESNDSSSMIKILIVDEGNEKIKVSAWINGGEAENVLIANFCKQINLNNENKEIKNSSTFELFNQNYKVMIAGSGQYCKVTQFSCETNFKENIDYFSGCNQGFNNCNCCSFI
jgi:hypothetical protein